MESILIFNPIKRLSATQCLQHPFFQCFDILSVYGLKINSNLHRANSNSPHLEFFEKDENKKKIKLNTGNFINLLNLNSNNTVTVGESSSAFSRKSNLLCNIETENNNVNGNNHMMNTPNFNVNKTTYVINGIKENIARGKDKEKVYITVNKIGKNKNNDIIK